MTATVDGSHAQVELHGELSLFTIERVRRALFELKHHGVRKLYVNLGGLTLLDTSGVALLLSIRHHAVRDGWRVTMAAPPDPLQRRIERLGLTERLPFVGAAS